MLNPHLEEAFLPSVAEIDEHDIGVLAYPVEHDALAIRRDIKRQHGRLIREVGEWTTPSGLEVQQPEVLGSEGALHVHKAFPIWQEPSPTPIPTHVDCGKLDLGSVWTHGQQRRVAPDIGAGVHNQPAVRRPDGD